LFLVKNEWITIGLGIAFSVSYLIGLPYTLWLLKKHTGVIRIRDFAGQHLRLIGAAFAVMTPLFVLVRYLDWAGVKLTKITRLGELAVIMVIAFLGYLLAAKTAGVEEITMIRHLKDSVLRRPEVKE
jgi:putative peptidoglycan lipid II flippase